MKALILREDADAAAAYTHALINKGFQVVCVETRKVAQALIRLHTIDLLVMDERLTAGLTHSLALSAERRNPFVSTIMLTDRPAFQTDELYSLIPCLYGLVGLNTSAALISQLALSSIENYEEAEARVRRNQMADEQARDGACEMAEGELPEGALEEGELPEGALEETEQSGLGMTHEDQAESAAWDTCPDLDDAVLVNHVVAAAVASVCATANPIDITNAEDDRLTDVAAFEAEAELSDDAFNDENLTDTEATTVAAEETTDTIDLLHDSDDDEVDHLPFDLAQIATLSATYSFTQFDHMFGASDARSVGAV